MVKRPEGCPFAAAEAMCGPARFPCTVGCAKVVCLWRRGAGHANVMSKARSRLRFADHGGRHSWTCPHKRVALVIGNSGYQHTPQLSNPAHDAVDVGTTLRRLKFDVIEGIDLDKAGMDRTIRQFARALGNADVGLLFYAGHGLQVNGQNYLVPIDAKLEDASGLDFELVRLDLIHRTMER